MDKKSMLESIINHYASGNKSQMARILNVSPQAISTWLSRNTFDHELIYSKCENINPHWLLTGRGSMLKTDTTPPMGDQDSHKEEDNRPVAIPTDNPKEGIPLIPVNAMAGALTSEQSVLEYECDRYVVPVFKGADFLIPVKGSSMYPKYSSGDIVACKRVPMTDLFFQWNKVYVLDTNQGALIKRIKRGSDSEHILIVSDNEAYEPFELPIRCIYNVAIVIGVIRLE